MIQPNSRHDARIHELVHEIREWPTRDRIALATRVLETIEPRDSSTPAKSIPLDQVFGMLKTDAPPPTDEDVKRIIEEEKMKKYGR